MRKMINVAVGLAMLAMPAIAQAQANAACLTEPEARALFTFAIPEGIEGVANKCKGSLPATAFMPSKSQEMVARFRAAAVGSWPAAKAAFVKIGKQDDDMKVLAAMPDSALQPFVSAAFSEIVAKDVKPQDCPKIDRFVAALASLSPANAADLITALIALVGSKEGDDFKLC
jgi:hypothetical protein